MYSFPNKIRVEPAHILPVGIQNCFIYVSNDMQSSEVWKTLWFDADRSVIIKVSYFM